MSSEAIAVPSDRTGRNIPVRIVAAVTLANGVTAIMLMLLHRFQEPRLFGLILPFGVYHWSRTITAALGFTMLYLSYHLLQRRRMAWRLAVLASALVMIGHLGHPNLRPAAFAPGFTLAFLLVFRHEFQARSEGRNIVQGLVLLALSLIASLLYGVVGFRLLSVPDLGMSFSFFDSLVRTLRQFTLIGNNDLVPYTHFARWFLDSLDFIGIVSVVFAAYSLFRPVAYHLVVLPHEQHDASEIIKNHGCSSYDYFKDKSDKSFFFSGTRRSFIAYRTVSGAALCLGDPVGPVNDVENAVAPFLHQCRANAWLACFLLPDDVSMYRDLGLAILKVGEEAVINLEQFETHTKRRKYFRYVTRKIGGEGYQFARYKPPHPRLLLDEVEQVSQEWLTLPHHREFGFFQGVFSRQYLEDLTICGVRDSAGKLLAWVNEVPSFRPGEATYDMTRHRPGIHWAIMDFLFANLLSALREEGFLTFNMGLAPLAGVGAQPGATALEKAVHQIYERFGRVVSMKGLRQYKAKFEPLWEERFMAYQGGAVGLVRIAVALSKVM